MYREFQNLIEMQEYSCRIHKNREIFGTKSHGQYKWVTYQEFKELVDKIRAGLHSLGVKEEERVGIISGNRVEWAVASYATMGLKAQFVPMYETQAAEDIVYIINDCSMKVLFVANKALLEKFESKIKECKSLQQIILIEEDSCDLLTYGKLLEIGQANPIPSRFPKADDLMGIIYTSGTTGNPKGVMLSHGNLIFNVKTCPQLIDVDKEDRTLSFLPWAHIFGQMAELHLLIYCGFSTAFAESTNTIIDNLAEIRPTLLLAVPRIFNRIYDSVHSKMREKPFPIRIMFNQAIQISKKRAQGKALTPREIAISLLAEKLIFQTIRKKFGGRLRYAISGASALNSEVAEFIDALKITVLEGYGLSETSPLVAINTLSAKKIGTVGKVVPGVTVKIDKSVLGENIVDCEEGEIIIYGPNVMKGYLGLPHENSAVFTADGGFRSGDLGRFDEDGLLHITGRIKEQYKLENGKYVVPNLIEEEIKLSPYITNAFVYGSNKSHNVALLGVNMVEIEKFAKIKKISSGGATLLESPQIKDLIQSELTKIGPKFKSYERPKDFILIQDDWTADNGILTPSLKLKRRVVYSRYKEMIEGLYFQNKL